MDPWNRSRRAAAAGALAVCVVAAGCLEPPSRSTDSPPSEGRRSPAPSESLSRSPRGSGRTAQGGSGRSGAGARPAEVPEDGSGAASEPEPSVSLAPLEASPGGAFSRAEVIRLEEVLRLAGTRQIDVERMMHRLERARAETALAEARLLPDIGLGAAYVRHDGRFQETRGDVFDVSRSSLGAVPEIRLRLDPAQGHFERLRALQLEEAAEAANARTRAEAMVTSALLYLDLVGTTAAVAVAREAADYARAQADLVRRKVEAGAELQVELSRAEAALARERGRLEAAEFAFRRASLALARWLRIPPSVLLVPAERSLAPLSLVDPNADASRLIEEALSARPEVRELEALQRAAEEHLRSETWRPWVPELELFAGYGVFGGGRGGFFGNFGDRVDAGAALTWTFEGLGFETAARKRRAETELRLAALDLEELREEIASEVAASFEEARSLRARIGAAEARVRAAEETLRHVETQYEAGAAIQLEVLAAAQELAEARAALIDALVRYNKAEHLLFYRVEGRAWAEEETGGGKEPAP